MCFLLLLTFFTRVFFSLFFWMSFFFWGGEHFFPDGFGHSSIPKIESSDRSKFFILTWDAG